MSRASIAVVSLLAVAVVVAVAFGGCTKERSGKLQIAVIPKGTTHEFWKAVHAGARVAAAEVGAEIVWKGPTREDDRAQQVAVVEDFIAAGVDGIVLAPLDDKALVPVVEEATAQGIPVVIIDSGLDDAAPRVTYVGTDNRAGGELAARRMGQLLDDQTGKVLVLRYQEGSASTTQREAGFLETLRTEYPKIEVVSSNQHGGATTESAYQAAESLLVRFPDVQGVFTPNESTTMGMLRALQDSGRAGKVWFVGFDTSDKLQQALREGQIHGLVLQNPFKMGELGLKAIVTHLRQGTLHPSYDTGVKLATTENMRQPDVLRLLEPDLSALR